jgi:peroxiredoxin
MDYRGYLHKAGYYFRKSRKYLAGLVVLYVAIAAGFVFVMREPVLFSRVMRRVPDATMAVFPFKSLWYVARAGRLHVGDQAPGFGLTTADRQATVSLASFRGQKPVVLVFGSYTWPPFRREVPALNKLYDQYKDRAAFYVVYIMEAHALDAWQDDDNQKDKISVASPKTLAERCAVEGTCATKLALRIPALIDNLANTTEEAYTAWPDRLYVIDVDGRVAYKSKPGPFGFKPARLEVALKKVLSNRPGATQMSQR